MAQPHYDPHSVAPPESQVGEPRLQLVPDLPDFTGGTPADIPHAEVLAIAKSELPNDQRMLQVLGRVGLVPEDPGQLEMLEGRLEHLEQAASGVTRIRAERTGTAPRARGYGNAALKELRETTAEFDSVPLLTAVRGIVAAYEGRQNLRLEFMARQMVADSLVIDE